MIIKLFESKLFTVDPAERFAKEYGVSKKLWDELWKRYLFYEYDTGGLCGYFMYKTKRNITPQAIERWVFRTQVYCKATHVMRMGQRVVDSQYFGSLEEALIDELTRNMRFSDAKDSKTIV